MSILSCICVTLALTQTVPDGLTGSPVATIMFEETFDGVTPPALPPGWRSSTTRSPGTADLSTAASSALSAPNAVFGSNATIEQWLMSGPLDRAAIMPATLSFALRRSSTFTARCVIEASTDGGVTFSILIGEAPAVFPPSSYQTVELPLPSVLAASDTFSLRWRFLPSATGSTGTVRLDDVRLLRPRQGVVRGAIVVNEIQHQPPAQQPEWIELFHTAREPVDLAGWSVSDAPAGTRHLFGPDVPMIQPGTYILVTADSASLRASTGTRSTIVQPDGFPSLNNSGDLVLLLDEEGNVMDSLRYDAAWGGGPGLSIERIDPSSLSHVSENWGSSIAASGATPGVENSIMIRPHDLRLKHFVQDRTPGASPGEFRAVVLNAGSERSGPFELRLKRTGNAQSDESMVSSITVSTELQPQDSLSCVCTWTDPPPGNHRITAEIIWAEDARPENNAASAEALIPIPRGSLRINEIHASPIGGSAEFVEIINTGTAPVSLAGCVIADRPLTHEQVRRWPVTASSPSLLSRGLHVVAGDSSVLFLPGVVPERCMVASRSGLGLNNDGDTVLLYGADSVLIDSVVYSAGWHSANISDPSGRSLERYHPDLSGTDPRNWGTCVDPTGSTPGRTNSIILTSIPSDATLACAPDPFSPDGDGYEDVTVMRYRMPLRSSLIRLRVFDIRGRCVRELVNVTPAGMTGEVVWDGAGEARVPLRMGIYIVHLEAIDDAGGQTMTAKCAVVLARRL